MREMKPGRLFAAAGLPLVLSLAALTGPAFPAVPQHKPLLPAGKDIGIPPPEEMERRIFEAVNKERSARNLPALRLSPALTVLARKQSRDMAGLGLLVHSSAMGQSYAERLEEAGVLFAATGENIARGDSADPDLIHGALMKSDGHRKNILHPDFDEVGIGIVRGTDGVCYVTQDFVKSVVVRDEASTRAFILAALDQVRLSRRLPPLVPVGDVHRAAQSFARLKSAGKALPLAPEGYGETRLVFFVGPDLERIAASLTESPLDRYGRVGVGVCFARTVEYSGGAYFVCVLLLVGDPALLVSGPLDE